MKAAAFEGKKMTGRERVLTAISHSEADRVSIDLGSSIATSINVKAYAALIDFLGYKNHEIVFYNVMAQLAKIDKNIYISYHEQILQKQNSIRI